MGFEGSEQPQWTNCEGKWKSLTAAYQKTIDHTGTGSNRRPMFTAIVLQFILSPHQVALEKDIQRAGRPEKKAETTYLPIEMIHPSRLHPVLTLLLPVKRVHAQDDSGTPKLKCRKKSIDEMVLWLKEYKKKKAAQEEHDLKEVKEMHKEQMELLGGFWKY